MKKDPNTVLFYTKEANEYNNTLDKEFGLSICDERYYRSFFWRFSNIDADGETSYDFANYGDVDMRGDDAEAKLEAAVALALARYLEREYRKACDGSPSEADENYNGLVRDVIAAYARVHPNACLGRINLNGPAYSEARNGTYRFEKYTGQKVYNFGADFIIPDEDEALREAIIAWAKEVKLESLHKINARISALHGVRLLWS